MPGAPLVEAFVVVCELGEAMNIKPLNQHDGCWEVEVDKRWKLAVNGHKEPKKCGLCETPIDPYTCYVTYNGWPAFIITPTSGCGAAGEAANENTFIAAVRSRIASEKLSRRPWPFPTGPMP